MSTASKTTQKKPHTSKNSTKANTKLGKKTNSPINDILNLHQTVGNQAVQQLFKSGVIQGSFAHTIKSTIQKKENNTGLPKNLKDGIESLSGYSMDDVKVHYNSPKPTQLNAHAYAKGSNIHLASGAEKHLPHEAWHVVQQKQGRVQPTKQLKGKVNINDNEGLEREADVMGDKALQIKKKRYSSRKRNKIQLTMKNTFHGRIGVFNSYKDSTFYTASDSLVGKLSTFSDAINYKSIGRDILYHIKKIHEDIILIPEHHYTYSITVNVYPDHNTFEVFVKLKNEAKHKKAGLKAKAKERAKTLEKENKLKKEAEKKAQSKLKKDEQAKAEIQDMKLIIMPTGTADLVKRKVWKAKEQELHKLIISLPNDIANWKKKLDKSYNEAGIIARIGYAYSGHGVTYSKPNLNFWWSSAYEYQKKAFLKLKKQDLLGAEHEMSMAILSVKRAEDIWRNWLNDSVRGASTAVKVLSFTKYSGQVAADSLATLTAQPQISVLYSVIGEEADQLGSFLSGTDADKAFSVGKIAKTGVLSYLTGKLGKVLGDTLIKKLGLSQVTSQCMANFLTSSALSEVVKRMDNKISSKKNPDDVILMLADNPTVQNIFKTVITSCK